MVMRRIGNLLLGSFLLAISGAVADEPAKKESAQKTDPQPPAYLTEFEAVKKEVEAKLAKFYATVEKEYEGSKTEEQRDAVVKRGGEASSKLLEPALEK